MLVWVCPWGYVQDMLTHGWVRTWKSVLCVLSIYDVRVHVYGGLSLCIYAYVYMYVYVRVFLYTFCVLSIYALLSMFVYVCTCTCSCVHVCVWSASACVYMCVAVRMCTRVCVCEHVCAYVCRRRVSALQACYVHVWNICERYICIRMCVHTFSCARVCACVYACACLGTCVWLYVRGVYEVWIGGIYEVYVRSCMCMDLYIYVYACIFVRVCVCVWESNTGIGYKIIKYNKIMIKIRETRKKSTRQKGLFSVKLKDIKSHQQWQQQQ